MRLTLLAAAVAAVTLSGSRVAAASPQTCGWLPLDRMEWWTATPPPSGPLRAADDFECWWEPPLHELVSFTGPSGQDANVGQTGFAFRGSGVLVDGGRDAAFPPRATRVLGERAYQRPLFIDFASPRRAVALELGLRYDEGYMPVGGAIDAEGIELRAYDGAGDLIGSTTLAMSSPTPSVRGGHTSFDLDLRLGLRDREARIASIELVLTDENARTATASTRRPIRAVPMIRAIHHEGLPPAAVTEGYVATDPGDSRGTVRVPVPYRLDRAVAILRGQRFAAGRDVIVPLLVSIEVGSGPVTVDGGGRHVEVTIDGTVLGAEGKSLEDVGAYFTLLAWEDTRVRALTSNVGRPGGVVRPPQSYTETVTDPCPGCAQENLVALLQGTLLALADESAGWDLWTHQLLPCSPGRVPGGGRVLSARLDTAPGEKIKGTHALTGFLMGGEDVRVHRPIACGDEYAQIDARPTVWRHARGGAWWDHYEEDLRRAGMDGKLEALVAGVGATALYVDANAGGALPVGGHEIELSAVSYDGHEVSARLGGGGLSAAPAGETSDPTLYYAVPTYVGLVPSTGSFELASEGFTEFLSYAPGTVVGPDVLAGVRNVGRGSLVLTDAALEGPDAGRFSSVELIAPSGQPMSFERLRQVGMVVAPGQRVQFRAFYRNEGEATATAFVRLFTSGGQRIDTTSGGLRGRLRPAGEWLPGTLGFGNGVLGSPSTRRAIFQALTGQPLAVTAVVEEGDLHDEFTVSWSGVSPLRPGDLLLATVTFTPRAGAPVGPRSLKVIARTALGDLVLPVTGITPAVPRPEATVAPTQLNFGIVTPGNERNLGITLSSVGAAPLRVTAVSQLSGDFVFISPPQVPVTLAPEGGELTLAVRFRPRGTVPGTRVTGTLTLTLDGGAPQIVVPLAGVIGSSK